MAKKGQLRAGIEELISWVEERGKERSIEKRTTKENIYKEVFEGNYATFKEALLESLHSILGKRSTYKKVAYKLKKEYYPFLKRLTEDDEFNGLYELKILEDGVFEISLKEINISKLMENEEVELKEEYIFSEEDYEEL